MTFQFKKEMDEDFDQYVGFYGQHSAAVLMG